MSRLPHVLRCLLVCGMGLTALPVHADKVPSRPPPPIAAPSAAPAVAPVAAPAVAPAETPTAPAAAPVAATPQAVKPDAEGFVPDSRPPTMNSVDVTVPAAPLVAIAYGFIWLAVIGFVLFTLQRTRKLEQEIAELAERIQKPAAKAPRA